MVSKRLAAAGAAGGFVVLGILGLAGWAVLLVLAAMVLLGTMVLANELARPFFVKGQVPHEEEEVRAARDEARQRRDGFGDVGLYG